MPAEAVIVAFSVLWLTVMPTVGCAAWVTVYEDDSHADGWTFIPPVAQLASFAVPQVR